MLDTDFREKFFSFMAEGWVTDIMAKGDGFDQIFVEIEKAPYGSGNARNQLNMNNPVGNVIVGDETEDLGFVDISAVGPGVKDTVGIEGKCLPVAILFFSFSPPCVNTAGCRGGESTQFKGVEVVEYGKKGFMCVRHYSGVVSV